MISVQLPNYTRGNLVLLVAKGVLLSAVCGAVIYPAMGYPEFQAYSEKHSGRSVNCAMCHVNGDGPTGDNNGQIGSLNEKQMSRLNAARAALKPGQDVDSPILNAFGNKIIKTIGMSKVLELMKDPSKLPAALGNKSDIDGDGIPDSREYEDGTDPLNPFHGDPRLLFIINLSRQQRDVMLAIIAVAATVFGLSNILKGLHIVAVRMAKGSKEE